jgi:DnaJ family protein C protein 28
MEQKRGPRDWESWIDQQIREAQERGEFDNLPGKGKPLDLTPNPYAQDQELTFKILKDAGYAPEWIELDRAIRSRLDQARAALARSWEWYQSRLQDLDGQAGQWAAAEQKRASNTWQRKIAGFVREAEALNKEIAEMNLKVPSPRFQRSMLDAAREIRYLTESSE